MNVSPFFLRLGIVLILWTHSLSSFASQLVDSDRPITSIACPTASQPTLRFAAEEIQGYLEKMSGIQLDIRERDFPPDFHGILLDSSTSSATLPITAAIPEMNPDAYRLRTLDSGLLILGSSDRAVLFGVYDLLERLGCRWLGPGEEYIPKIDSLRLSSFDISAEPSLRWRALELIAGITPAMVDWMAKVRLNVVWPETYTPKEDLAEDDRALASCAIPEIRKRGLSVFWGGHLLPLLFSASKYGAEHPEYFALIDGKRLDPNTESAARWQLCTSNPEVVRILCENVIRFLENHPWIEVLFLWGNDTVRWCECDACRALEPAPDKSSPFGGLDRSVTYCRMVKLVSEAVATALPGRRVAFNHYYNLEDLPKDKEGQVNTSILPGPEVLSAVDAYHQCDRHAFTDPTCPCGKRIEPIARMWSPHYKENIGWTYYFAWNFTLGLPVGMGHKMAADFKFFRDLGITGVVDNVSLHPASLQASNNRLNYYLYAKAAWDPDFDLDSVERDFLDHYYGPAREPMRAFWDLSEETWTRFGLHPEYIPEDDRLAATEAMHGRLIDALDRILADGEPRSTDPRLLIPNRSVHEKMLALLTQSETLVLDDPLLSHRIGTLKALVEKWDAERPAAYRIVGFLNGGGNLTNYLYRGTDEISCTVCGGGGGEGDCFSRESPGMEVLANPGDSFEVEVRINYGSEVIGEPTYRSGPGLYQAQDETTPCGQEGACSVMLFIGHQDSEEVGAHRVMALVSDGKFQSEILSSPDGVWKYGDYVRLRIQFTESTAQGFTYSYSYRRGDQWTEIGAHTFAKKLPFAAPMHRWGGLEKGAKASFPLINWASIRFDGGSG